MDFSKGTQSIEVSVAPLYGGMIEIHTDAVDGPILGTVKVTGKAEGDVFRTIKTPVKNTRGIHDLYFVFKGDKDLFYFDWWKFNEN
uniref:Carbohydrate-binding protein n=1 Tax=Chryseobacterium endophyticum TaxID=1854762 RepID=A0AAU6WJP2_9FLAO